MEESKVKTAEEILKECTGHAHGLTDAMHIKAMEIYADQFQSHITKLEAESLINEKDSQEENDFFDKQISITKLQERTKGLEEALESIRYMSKTVTMNHEHGYNKMKFMGELAEQALNKK